MKTHILLATLLCCGAPIATVSHAQTATESAQSFGSRARLKEIKRNGKSWNATASYPVFRAQTSLARYANSQLRLDAQKQLSAGGAELAKYLADDPAPENPYAWELTPRLSFYGPNAISVEQDIFYDMSGAHPNTVINALNYGRSGGRLKRLTLGDCFAPGSQYRAATANKVLAKLKQSGASSVADGTVKTLTTAQLNNFVIEADGLKWIFSPYEMASYAEGIIEAKLKISELGPNFRRELLKK